MHQGVNVHLLKHEIICDQHQSEFLFFLSVAHRPLIIHPCLLAPSSKFGNSISSMHMHTSTHVHTHLYCILTNNRNKRIHQLWNTAVWRVTSTKCAAYMTADVIKIQLQLGFLPLRIAASFEINVISSAIGALNHEMHDSWTLHHSPNLIPPAIFLKVEFKSSACPLMSFFH